MVKKEIPIVKAGQLVHLSQVEYSDYGICGSFVTLQNITVTL